MGIIAELLQSGALPAFWDFRKGSFLDQSGHGVAVNTFNGSGHRWISTSEGPGISGTASSEYSGGVAPSLNLTTATVFYLLCMNTLSVYPPTTTILSKSEGPGTAKNGYTCVVDTAFTFYLGDNAGFQSTNAGTVASAPIGPMFIAHSFNGTLIRNYRNGTVYSSVAQTRVPSPAGQLIRLGLSAFNGLRLPVLAAGVSSRALTLGEVSRLYTELIQNRGVVCPRGPFIQVPTSMTDALCTAQNVVFDTVFARNSNNKLGDDSPTNNEMTINGNLISENSLGVIPLKFDGAGYLQAVIDQSLISGFSVEFVARCNSAAADCPLLHPNNANTYPNISSQLQLWEYRTAFGVNVQSSSVLQNQWQHAVLTVTSAGGGNVACTWYFDGDSVATGTIAQGASLGASGYFIGRNGVSRFFGSVSHLRIFNSVLAPAQAKAEYLKNFGQKLMLRETFEDVPVTISAPGVGGVLGNRWVVSRGTCASVEDATTGRRSLQSTAAPSTISLAYKTPPFGTWVFRMLSVGVNGDYVQFVSTGPLYYGFTGSQGYALLFLGGLCYLYYYTAGGGGGAMLAVPGATFTPALNTEYEFCVARRPQDGSIKLWVRGGAYPNWVYCGSTAAHSGVVSDSSYIVVNCAATGGKIVLYDPNDKRCCLRHYKGALNPIAGELP